MINARNTVAVIFPARALHMTALREARRRGLVLQTDYRATLAAPKLLPGWVRVGARSKS